MIWAQVRRMHAIDKLSAHLQMRQRRQYQKQIIYRNIMKAEVLVGAHKMLNICRASDNWDPFHVCYMNVDVAHVEVYFAVFGPAERVICQFYDREMVAGSYGVSTWC